MFWTKGVIEHSFFYANFGFHPNHQRMGANAITAKEIQKELTSRQDALVEDAVSKFERISEEPDRLECLKSLGFSMSAQKAEHEMWLAESMLSFEKKYRSEYSGLKFISEAAMGYICRKYSLTIGPVARFTGEVPMWALQQIKKNQKLFRQTKMEPRFVSGRWVYDDGTFVQDEGNKRPSDKFRNNLMIAAPKEQMFVNWFEDRDASGRIGLRTDLDPIVSLQVEGGYIVLAAWDEEGQDPRVFNAENN